MTVALELPVPVEEDIKVLVFVTLPLILDEEMLELVLKGVVEIEGGGE